MRSSCSSRDSKFGFTTWRANLTLAKRQRADVITIGQMDAAAASFLVLVAVSLAGPYVLGVAPRTRRQWLCLALTLAFLAWLLPLMASLRSR